MSRFWLVELDEDLESHFTTRTGVWCGIKKCEWSEGGDGYGRHLAGDAGPHADEADGGAETSGTEMYNAIRRYWRLQRQAKTSRGVSDGTAGHGVARATQDPRSLSMAGMAAWMHGRSVIATPTTLRRFHPGRRLALKKGVRSWRKRCHKSGPLGALRRRVSVCTISPTHNQHGKDGGRRRPREFESTKRTLAGTRSERVRNAGRSRERAVVLAGRAVTFPRRSGSLLTTWLAGSAWLAQSHRDDPGEWRLPGGARPRDDLPDEVRATLSRPSIGRKFDRQPCMPASPSNTSARRRSTTLLSVDDARHLAAVWRPRFSDQAEFELSWSRYMDSATVPDVARLEAWLAKDADKSEVKHAGIITEPLVPVLSRYDLNGCYHCYSRGFVRLALDAHHPDFGKSQTLSCVPRLRHRPPSFCAACAEPSQSSVPERNLRGTMRRVPG